MNVSKLILQFFLFCFITINAQAKNQINDKPYSFKHILPIRIVQQKVTPKIDSLRIFLEDKNDTKNGTPPRFGFPFPVNYNLENSGTWTIMPDSSKLWELTIVCKKALSINLLYDKFWLPDSSKFYIYNERKSQILGAFTNNNNNSGTKKNPKAFTTGLVFGDTIHLEYHEPKHVASKGVISISRIVHGYQYINNNIEGLSGGSPNYCNININCPQEEGRNWQIEKRGVALILIDGIRAASGCLVTNSNQDGSPYLLTANHILMNGDFQIWDSKNDTDLSSWSFMWNYESPDCANQDVNNYITTSGALLVANGLNTDFALLKLSQVPVNNENVYYCGWDYSDKTPYRSVCIHHPLSDIKKITFDNDPPEITGYNDETVCVNPGPSGTTHWRILSWNKGVTLGGSSGSPLFNQDHRIIGQLHGGCVQCEDSYYSNEHFGPNESDYFGRFSKSWNGGSSDPKRQLKDWLDPYLSVVNALDGTFCHSTLLENKTYSSDETVADCRLELHNVLITNNAKIGVITRSLTIPSDFEVILGSVFEVNVGTTSSPGIVVPVLYTTDPVSGLNCNFVTSGGNVCFDGGATITGRGVCWSTTPNPTIANSKTTDPGTTGSWNSGSMTIVPGMSYFVRSYATNSAGTGYGAQVSYARAISAPSISATMQASSITYNSATSGGTIFEDHCSPITERGICWATTSNPTTANTTYVCGTTGTGSFTGNLTGLAANTYYYVRCYATNSVGTSYGDQTSFYPSVIYTPTLDATSTVSRLACHTATSGGSINLDGGAPITEKGVCWSTTQNPTTSNSKVLSGSGTASFSTTLSPVWAGITYYVRSYAINLAGTGYGAQVSYKGPLTVPLLAATTNASSITSSSAISGGNVTSDGCGSLSFKGICWSTTQNPTTANSKASVYPSTGAFSANLTGLSASTTYYIRSCATNTAGTSYGTQTSFETLTSAALTQTSVSGGPTYIAVQYKVTLSSPAVGIKYFSVNHTNQSNTYYTIENITVNDGATIGTLTITYNRQPSLFNAVCNFNGTQAGYTNITSQLSYPISAL